MISWAKWLESGEVLGDPMATGHKWNSMPWNFFFRWGGKFNGSTRAFVGRHLRSDPQTCPEMGWLNLNWLHIGHHSEKTRLANVLVSPADGVWATWICRLSFHVCLDTHFSFFSVLHLHVSLEASYLTCQNVIAMRRASYVESLACVTGCAVEIVT